MGTIFWSKVWQRDQLDVKIKMLRFVVFSIAGLVLCNFMSSTGIY